jgi:hypothetical protein
MRRPRRIAAQLARAARRFPLEALLILLIVAAAWANAFRVLDAATENSPRAAHPRTAQPER